MNNSALINQDSGNVEWYTPKNIIEAARLTMGGIDLDPASCETANETVKAKRFFSRADNGLAQKWQGRVWMNHPFSRADNPLWIKKLVDEYESGSVIQACCITYASTSEPWYRPLLLYPQCYLHGRTKYIGGGTKPPKGSVVTYFGNDLRSFFNAFMGLGAVSTPLTPALIEIMRKL